MTTENRSATQMNLENVARFRRRVVLVAQLEDAHTAIIGEVGWHDLGEEPRKDILAGVGIRASAKLGEHGSLDLHL